MAATDRDRRRCGCRPVFIGVLQSQSGAAGRADGPRGAGAANGCATAPLRCAPPSSRRHRFPGRSWTANGQPGRRRRMKPAKMAVLRRLPFTSPEPVGPAIGPMPDRSSTRFAAVSSLEPAEHPSGQDDISGLEVSAKLGCAQLTSRVSGVRRSDEVGVVVGSVPDVWMRSSSCVSCGLDPGRGSDTPAGRIAVSRTVVAEPSP